MSHRKKNCWSIYDISMIIFKADNDSIDIDIIDKDIFLIFIDI